MAYYVDDLDYSFYAGIVWNEEKQAYVPDFANGVRNPYDGTYVWDQDLGEWIFDQSYYQGQNALGGGMAAGYNFATSSDGVNYIIGQDDRGQWYMIDSSNAGSFVEATPKEGTPITEPTTVTVLGSYNGATSNVTVTVYDTADNVIGTTTSNMNTITVPIEYVENPADDTGEFETVSASGYNSTKFSMISLGQYGSCLGDQLVTSEVTEAPDYDIKVRRRLSNGSWTLETASTDYPRYPSGVGIFHDTQNPGHLYIPYYTGFSSYNYKVVWYNGSVWAPLVSHWANSSPYYQNATPRVFVYNGIVYFICGRVLSTSQDSYAVDLVISDLSSNWNYLHRIGNYLIIWSSNNDTMVKVELGTLPLAYSFITDGTELADVGAPVMIDQPVEGGNFTLYTYGDGASPDYSKVYKRLITSTSIGAAEEVTYTGGPLDSNWLSGGSVSRDENGYLIKCGHSSVNGDFVFRYDIDAGTYVYELLTYLPANFPAGSDIMASYYDTCNKQINYIFTDQTTDTLFMTGRTSAETILEVGTVNVEFENPQDENSEYVLDDIIFSGGLQRSSGTAGDHAIEDNSGFLIPHLVVD